jgi:RNase P protein component
MAQDDKEQNRASKQFHAAIDRMEDNGMAVLMVGDDEQTQVDLPVSLLPDGASDGDHLRITLTLDRASRAAARNRIKRLQDQLVEQSGTQDKTDFKL